MIVGGWFQCSQGWQNMHHMIIISSGNLLYVVKSVSHYQSDWRVVISGLVDYLGGLNIFIICLIL